MLNSINRYITIQYAEFDSATVHRYATSLNAGVVYVDANILLVKDGKETMDFIMVPIGELDYVGIGGKYNE